MFKFLISIPLTITGRMDFFGHDDDDVAVVVVVEEEEEGDTTARVLLLFIVCARFFFLNGLFECLFLFHCFLFFISLFEKVLLSFSRKKKL